MLNIDGSVLYLYLFYLYFYNLTNDRDFFQRLQSLDNNHQHNAILVKGKIKMNQVKKHHSIDRYMVLNRRLAVVRIPQNGEKDL
jgi:hypothetical protein